MTDAQIILAIAPYAIIFVVVAAIVVAAALDNRRIHRLMDRRVSELFPN